MQPIRESYLNNKLEAQLTSAQEFLEWLETTCGSLDAADIAKLDLMIESMVTNQKNTVSNFIYLMRYYRMTKRHDLFIHLTRYTGFLNVIENILARLKQRVDGDVYDKITHGFQLPWLGIKPIKLPEFIRELLTRMEQALDQNTIAQVLAGNNHGMPEAAFMGEKRAYEAAPDLATYLRELQERKVAELEEHYRQNKVWYEQEITPEVIDFVRSNQEIMSARLENDKLYMTKIPYDTVSYLHAKTLSEKQYYGCHCPFAREAIGKVPALLCHCSGGFGKFPFEVIFGQTLPVKSMETILGGSAICRFEVDLAGVDYKGKVS